MDDSRDSRQTRLTGHLKSGDGTPLSDSTHGQQAEFQTGLDGPAAHTPLAGSFGKYLIERIIGEGAMGIVYLATDQDLQRAVALKIPKFDGGSTAELRERFFVEARAAAALRHTKLCPVYEVGELNDRCFLAMAYIDGRPLSDFVSPAPHRPGRHHRRPARRWAGPRSRSGSHPQRPQAVQRHHRRSTTTDPHRLRTRTTDLSTRRRPADRRLHDPRITRLHVARTRLR